MHMNSWIKKIFTRTARATGYEVIPAWMLKHYELSNHLRELFNQLNIKCVLDVGANAGQYRDFLRNIVGYEYLIISFEPQPTMAEILKEKSSSDPNWKVYNYALGSEDGEKILNITASSPFSSFLTPDNSHIAELADSNVVKSEVSVTIHRLDTVIDDIKKLYGIENIYLKLDTQGFDLEVINGSENTLNNILALQSEIPIIKIYNDSPDIITSLSSLLDRGFQITGMFPVNRDTYLRVIDIDCVMINNSAIPH